MNRDLTAIRPAAEPYISIVWQVSDWCNYRCSYCSEHNWGGRHRNADFGRLERGLRRIFEHYQELGYRNFKLFLSGGEPTFWEPLTEVLQLAQECLPAVRCAVNTNLSRRRDWWEKNHLFFDDVICSFHVESARPERFLENFVFLHDKINYLVARMMMHEERFDEVLGFAERLKSESPTYRIEYVPLFRELSNQTEPWVYRNPLHRQLFERKSWEARVAADVPSRSRAQTASVEMYRDGSSVALNSNRLVAERQNFFSGWTCWVQESVFIDARGNVSLATCGQTPTLGNLFEGDLRLPSKPIRCTKFQCHCGTDICITKTAEAHG